MTTLLDTPAEVHAATHGIYAGLTEWKGAQLPDDPDITADLTTQTNVTFIWR